MNRGRRQSPSEYGRYDSQNARRRSTGDQFVCREEWVQHSKGMEMLLITGGVIVIICFVIGRVTLLSCVFLCIRTT